MANEREVFAVDMKLHEAYDVEKELNKKHAKALQAKEKQHAFVVKMLKRSNKQKEEAEKLLEIANKELAKAKKEIKGQKKLIKELKERK